MRITSNDVTDHLRREERRLQESAERALDKLIEDAKMQRAQLIERGYPRTTVGGSALNSQHFSDAERALTQLHVIADARALAEEVAS